MSNNLNEKDESYKEFEEYEGINPEKFIHIPQISVYNYNYYVGIKRKGEVSNDLLLAKSDDDNTTYWSILDHMQFVNLGYSFFDEKEIIHLGELY